mgnify:CR=1 FL=1
MATNKDRPIIQSHGYNGSEPTRICPHCGKEKPLSEFGFRKIKTLAAWHLLAGGRQADAVRIFESAVTGDKAARPITRFADTMARRWLTRIDHAKVEVTLKTYYADNVEHLG